MRAQLGVTAATLTAWRDAFLAAGEAALTTKPATAKTWREAA
jgi:transposase